MRVAVIFGGRSSEHEVSLRSGASVAAGLRAAGHEVVEVLIERDGRWLADGEEVELRAAGGLLGAEVAFPVLHGPFGEDGTVQGHFEMLGLRYTGAGVAASAIGMDKQMMKLVLAGSGLPIGGFTTILPGQWDADRAGCRAAVAGLGMPVYVKPARGGCSRCRSCRPPSAC